MTTSWVLSFSRSKWVRMVIFMVVRGPGAVDLSRRVQTGCQPGHTVAFRPAAVYSQAIHPEPSVMADPAPNTVPMADPQATMPPHQQPAPSVTQVDSVATKNTP